MKIDYSGVSILIGAIVAAIGSLATTIMQWRAAKKIDENKEEAIAARHEQTNTIIQSAVTPALNAVPPVTAETPIPVTDPDPDKDKP